MPDPKSFSPNPPPEKILKALNSFRQIYESDSTHAMAMGFNIQKQVELGLQMYNKALIELGLNEAAINAVFGMLGPIGEVLDLLRTKKIEHSLAQAKTWYNPIAIDRLIQKIPQQAAWKIVKIAGIAPTVAILQNFGAGTLAPILQQTKSGQYILRPASNAGKIMSKIAQRLEAMASGDPKARLEHLRQASPKIEQAQENVQTALESLRQKQQALKVAQKQNGFTGLQRILNTNPPVEVAAARQEVEEARQSLKLAREQLKNAYQPSSLVQAEKEIKAIRRLQEDNLPSDHPVAKAIQNQKQAQQMLKQAIADHDDPSRIITLKNKVQYYTKDLKIAKKQSLKAARTRLKAAKKLRFKIQGFRFGKIFGFDKIAYTIKSAPQQKNPLAAIGKIFGSIIYNLTAGVVVRTGQAVIKAVIARLPFVGQVESLLSRITTGRFISSFMPNALRTAGSFTSAGLSFTTFGSAGLGAIAGYGIGGPIGAAVGAVIGGGSGWTLQALINLSKNAKAMAWTSENIASRNLLYGPGPLNRTALAIQTKIWARGLIHLLRGTVFSLLLQQLGLPTVLQSIGLPAWAATAITWSPAIIDPLWNAKDFLFGKITNSLTARFISGNISRLFSQTFIGRAMPYLKTIINPGVFIGSQIAIMLGLPVQGVIAGAAIGSLGWHLGMTALGNAWTLPAQANMLGDTLMGQLGGSAGFLPKASTYFMLGYYPGLLLGGILQWMGVANAMLWVPLATGSITTIFGLWASAGFIGPGFIGTAGAQLSTFFSSISMGGAGILGSGITLAALGSILSLIFITVATVSILWAPLKEFYGTHAQESKCFTINIKAYQSPTSKITNLHLPNHGLQPANQVSNQDILIQTTVTTQPGFTSSQNQFIVENQLQPPLPDQWEIFQPPFKAFKDGQEITNQVTLNITESYLYSEGYTAGFHIPLDPITQESYQEIADIVQDIQTRLNADKHAKNNMIDEIKEERRVIEKHHDLRQEKINYIDSLLNGAIHENKIFQQIISDLETQKAQAEADLNKLENQLSNPGLNNEQKTHLNELIRIKKEDISLLEDIISDYKAIINYNQDVEENRQNLFELKNNNSQKISVLEQTLQQLEIKEQIVRDPEGFLNKIKNQYSPGPGSHVYQIFIMAHFSGKKDDAASIEATANAVRSYYLACRAYDIVILNRPDIVNMYWPGPGPQSCFSSYGPRYLPEMPNLGCHFHAGIDISKNAFGGIDGKVYPSLSGVVYHHDYNSVFGHYIIINHQNGWYTIYGHFGRDNAEYNWPVNRGDKVARTSPSLENATVIGTIGDSGEVTGPHLHFGISDHPSNFSGEKALRHTAPPCDFLTSPACPGSCTQANEPCPPGT